MFTPPHLTKSLTNEDNKHVGLKLNKLNNYNSITSLFVVVVVVVVNKKKSGGRGQPPLSVFPFLVLRWDPVI